MIWIWLMPIYAPLKHLIPEHCSALQCPHHVKAEQPFLRLNLDQLFKLQARQVFDAERSGKQNSGSEMTQ